MTRNKKSILVAILCCFALSTFAQADRWQQRISYKIDADVNVETNIIDGKAEIVYYNNSPDKLDRIFMHLYWNAFQPGSAMDQRSLWLGETDINGKPDWDGRVTDRISKLSPKEIGYQKISSLKVNGEKQEFIYHGTILEVKLTTPINPTSKATISMEYESQVPLQIRRSGRDNPKTGVRYSMSQWYPKVCEYDYEGWHPTPYVAREFYGVWGDYDVTINIDKTYKLGGTGILVNADEIGWGYDKPGTKLKAINTAKRTWHFLGQNVHDFVWAADPDYVHLSQRAENGTMINVIYNAAKPDGPVDKNWQTVVDAAIKVLPFIEKNFGKYPYPQYTFIQGGDGGMEYPMATLIQSPHLGTVFHEWMHSWYQMMLGTNESLYPWMDEGFTSYADDLVGKYYSGDASIDPYKKALEKNPGNEKLKALIESLPDNHSGAYSGYFALTKSGLAEPLTTHADHYNTNYAYGISSYSKGEMFIEQLGYIVGAEMRDKIMLAYYDQWKFKHPNANDFVVVAQKESGIMLDWYKMYWINTTKTIDYAIDTVKSANGKQQITLIKIGDIPMPLDVEVTFADGSTEMYNIPLDIMYGSKKNENAKQSYKVEKPWQWTSPSYTVELSTTKKIAKVEIDPSKRMADVDRTNNVRLF